ncbi:MAG: hypothetical protein WC759_04305 [Candidatus Micrarchaeia archaeon]|jgi:hypothetical protein
MPLITSSRTPSTETRAFCRRLTSLLPGSVFEQRGKKAMEDILKKAEALGMSRVLVVNEKDAKPCSIGSMEVGSGGAGWREEELRILEYKMGKPGQKPKPTSFTVAGDAREFFSHFTGIEEEMQASEPDEMASYVEAGKKEIIFMYGGESSLEMKYTVIAHAKG